MINIYFYQVKRNDLVFALEQVGDASGSWNRVVGVDHEPGHPIALLLADGTKLIGDARQLVSVRRFEVIK